MNRILSFGAGLQTTALAILVAQGKVQVAAVVFADTGAEKPETYWYMDNYTKPLIESMEIPFHVVHSTRKSENMGLYGWLYNMSDIPNVRGRRQCSWHFKRQVIDRYYPQALNLVGFSVEEKVRADKALCKTDQHPLIELGLTGSDCRQIIQDYGWPIPTKSSCFFCPFQRPAEWQWLKRTHRDLFDKALALEARFYERKPQFRNDMGLFGGKPLWHYAEGRQEELFSLQENSCWDGMCSH